MDWQMTLKLIAVFSAMAAAAWAAFQATTWLLSFLFR
jgi:hypothetical protein